MQKFDIWIIRKLRRALLRPSTRLIRVHVLTTLEVARITRIHSPTPEVGLLLPFWKWDLAKPQAEDCGLTRS